MKSSSAIEMAEAPVAQGQQPAPMESSSGWTNASEQPEPISTGGHPVGDGGELPTFRGAHLHSFSPSAEAPASPKLEEWNQTEAETASYPVSPVLRPAHADFLVEELGEGEHISVGEAEIIRPDAYESLGDSEELSDSEKLDAKPIRDLQTSRRRKPRINRELVQDLQDMSVSPPDQDFDGNDRRPRPDDVGPYSPGIIKRSHSQSVGKDDIVMDVEELDGHDFNGSARRMRRRVLGPSD